MKRPYQTPQYSFQLKLWLLILGIIVVIMLILTEKSIAQKLTAENTRSTLFIENVVHGADFKTYKSRIVANKKGNRIRLPLID